MPSNVVVVESPAKVKTISGYLGSDYKVLASYGHVRDLPSTDGAVRPQEDFAMSWSMKDEARKHMKDIAGAVKDCDTLLLATDPDREGEAISWHIVEILKDMKALDKKGVKRVSFNAITRDAVLKALETPRNLDENLIGSYLARRGLDYLFGFTLSPILWRKLPGARSAGRVQSVALRLICARENEIEVFKSRAYWSIHVQCVTPNGETFEARLVELAKKKLAKFDLHDAATAQKARQAVQDADLSVHELQTKPVRRFPAPPFITATLQQEASRKLNLSAAQTMRVAQKLYEGGGEGGYITYMRTDSVQIDSGALHNLRHTLTKLYGKSYVPDKPNFYKKKAKSAQEAHEAIRPVDFTKTPESLRGVLRGDEAALYELIWKRTLASQMTPALLDRTTVTIADANQTVSLAAHGTIMRFEGFLTLYREGSDDTPKQDKESEDFEESKVQLPSLKEGMALEQQDVKAEEHHTEPPPRYSEASLVKKLEQLDIGRPSTYASTLSLLRDRAYVRMDRKRFHPEDKGRIVTAFLENFFNHYVEYNFTADLEKGLDAIAMGNNVWQEFLRNFWKDFSGVAEGIAAVRTTEVLNKLNDALAEYIFPDTQDGAARGCPSCDEGQLSLKVGKFGPFVGCSGYPECRYTRPLTGQGPQAEALPKDKELGVMPDSEDKVFLKNGPYGPYVQLGEAVKGEPKPKRTSLPKDMPIETVDIEKACAMLKLPRLIGQHPQTDKPVESGFGRFGAFVRCDKTYARLSASSEVFDIGLNRAVTLLAENAQKGKRKFGVTVLKNLGNNPSTKDPVDVCEGRYGPYVRTKGKNASLPKDMSVEDITLDQALEIIAKAKAKPSKKSRGRSKKT